MKKIFYCLILMVAVTIGFQFSADAGKMEKSKDAAKKMSQQMPVPGPEMKKLNFLVGEWKIKEWHEKSAWSPAEMEGNGIDVVTKGPGGFSLINVYSSSSPKGAFEGHGVVTWDPATKTYKSHWFDSMMPGGTVMTGQWKGKKLVFTGTSEMHGKMIKTKYVYSDISQKGYKTAFFIAEEGEKMKKVMTLKAKKGKN